MAHATQIQEHMRVQGSCGNQLGVVDHVEGDAIKLTKNDSPDHQHHFIPTSWVENVSGQTVTLDRDCDQAQRDWR